MSSFKVVNNSLIKHNSLKYFPISKTNSVVVKPLPHVLCKNQEISNNEITYVSTSGKLTKVTPLVVFDNTTSPIEITLPDFSYGTEVKFMVSYLDGMPVTVHTNNGSFVLSYPDISRHLIYY